MPQDRMPATIGDVFLDTSHSLYRNLVAAVVATREGMYELTTNQRFSGAYNAGTARTPAYKGSPQNSIIAGNGSNFLSLTRQTGFDTTTTGPFSIVAEVSPENGNQSFIVGSSDFTNGRGIFLGTDDYSLGTNGIFLRTNGSGSVFSGSGTLTTALENFVHRIAVTYDGAGTLKFYANGTLVNTATYTASGTADSGRRLLVFGNDGGARTTSGLGVALMYNKALSQEEVSALTANPYDVLYKYDLAPSTKPVWDKQPTIKSGITRDDLSREIDFAFYCTASGVFDAKNGVDVPFLNDQIIVGTPEGYAYTGQTAATRLAFTLKSRMTGNRAFTYIFLVRNVGYYPNGTVSQIFLTTWGSGTNISLSGPDWWDFRRWYYTRGSSGNTEYLAGPNNRILSNTYTPVIVRYVPNTGFTVIDKYGVSFNNIGGGYPNNAPLNTPVDAGFYTYANANIISMGAGWTRALSDIECERLLQNPWSLFDRQGSVTLLTELTKYASQPQETAELENTLRHSVVINAARSILPINEVTKIPLSIGGGWVSSASSVLTPHGAAIRCNGTLSSINFFSIPTNGISTRAFTVRAIIFVRSTSGAGVGIRCGVGNILLRNNAGAYAIRIGGVDYSGGTFATNTWLFYELVSSEAGVRLTVNGTDVINSSTVGGTGTLSDGTVFVDGGGGGAMDADLVFLQISSGTSSRAFNNGFWSVFQRRILLPQNITPKENRKPEVKESTMLGTSKRVLSRSNLLPVLARKYNKQPQVSYQLDNSKRFSQYIAAILIPSNIGTLAEYPVYVGNGVSIKNSIGGTAYQHSDTTSFVRSRFVNPYTSSGTSGSIALLVHFRLKAAPGADRTAIAALGSDTGDPGNSLCVVSCDTSGFINTIASTSGTNLGWVNSGISANDLQPHTVLLEIRVSPSGVSLSSRMTVDGKVQIETNGVGLGGPLPYQHLCALGTRRTTDLDGELNAEVFGCVAFLPKQNGEYGFSPHEALSITKNPWQLFKQQTNLILPSGNGG